MGRPTRQSYIYTKLQRQKSEESVRRDLSCNPSTGKLPPTLDNRSYRLKMGGHGTEVAKTVMEVADVAWTAVEGYHHHHHHHDDDHHQEKYERLNDEKELEAMRLENKRLRNLLEQNLKLLQNLAESPCLVEDCPPNLHARLMETVESPKFLTKLESLFENSTDGTGCKFPFKEASGNDLESAEKLINLDLEEPNWWVWVSDPMCPSNVEERSGIDDENYVVVSEEHVVDGVANFMARCIISNPKAQKMSPQEMQKTLTKALGGMNKVEKMVHVWHAGKIFWTLSTWGLAMAGFYQTRAVVKLAALGVHTTSKAILMAL